MSQADSHMATLTKLVNESGLPLQMALAEVVRKQARHWEVRLEEFTWKHPSGAMGHLDLLLKLPGDSKHMVVEVKRPKTNREWIFLVPSDAKSEQAEARILFQRRRSPPDNPHGEPELEQWWCLATFDPQSHVARWCAPRTDEGLLERLGAELIQSTEAVGHYLAQTRYSSFLGDKQWLFSCALVTTAKLYVARLPLERISLQHGAAEEELDIQPVPFLRFTKSFTAPSAIHSPDGEPLQDFDELAADNDRTLFVVQAQNFVEFLDQWAPVPGMAQPWMIR
jgi:hypothetical protein